MTTGLDKFDNKIHDLIEQENKCDELFKDMKNGNGENSLPYLTLRDACKELKKDIFRSARSAGLSRESITMKINEVRSKTKATSTNQTQQKSA